MPGIGEGFAAMFLKEFGTSMTLLQNIDKVKGPKKQQSLREHAETARRARGWWPCATTCRSKLDWEELRITQADVESLKALCVECGFHRFLTQLAGPRGPPSGAADTWVADYRLVHTPELFGEFLTELKRQPRFCIDTDTTAIDPLRAFRWWGIVGELEGRRGLLLAFLGQSIAGVLDPLSGARGLETDPGRPPGREGGAEHQVRHARLGSRG